MKQRIKVGLLVGILLAVGLSGWAQQVIGPALASPVARISGASISARGGGVTVNGTTATITSPGTYLISGTLSDGRILVNSPKSGLVKLVLNGVSITSTKAAPIYVAQATQTEVFLVEGSVNRVTDPGSYVYDDPINQEPNAAVFSDDLLTVTGPGSLIVTARFNDGIASKDGLFLGAGTLDVTAVDDGIRGKDYLVVNGGSIDVHCGGDGLKADNEVDTGLGYISILDGVFNITSVGDGISATSSATIEKGAFTIVAGGGHLNTIATSASAKGIKGFTGVTILGGTFTMDCADDGVHSDNAITVGGGTLIIATNNSTSAGYGDGLHANNSLDFNGGTVTVTSCYEGAESSHITFNGGTLRVASTDDGINASQGTSNWIHIYGGYIVVNAQGDGIDANGAIVMTNGTVIVNGPTADNNAAIDYDTTFKISGGFLIAAGSAGMAQAPSTSSTQRSIKVTYTAAKAAGTLARIQMTSGGTGIATFAPAKQYRSLVVSSPALTSGLSCQLYRAGTCTGAVLDGLYTGGVYTPGTLSNSFTTTNIVTNVSAP